MAPPGDHPLQPSSQGAELRARLARLESVLTSSNLTHQTSQLEDQEVVYGELEEPQDMTITFEDEEQENAGNKVDKDRVEVQEQIQFESNVATEENVTEDNP